MSDDREREPENDPTFEEKLHDLELRRPEWERSYEPVEEEGEAVEGSGQRRKTLEEARAMVRAGLPARYLYRKGDPATSRISARLGRTFRPSHRARLLCALIRGRKPMTVRECARRADISHYAATKRFSELKKLGLVEGTGREVETDAGGVAELYLPAVEVSGEESSQRRLL